MKNKLNTSGIIFEDEKILVVNKPAGLVVNRSETVKEQTLQDELSAYFSLKEGELGVGGRAGIVHRLDKETSGLIVVAKNEKTFLNLQGQFQERKVDKKYVALVHGNIKSEEGEINGQIGRIGKFGKFGITKNGREALTFFKRKILYELPREKFEEYIYEKGFTKSRVNYLKNHAVLYSLLEVFPKSGRTHQIRVHLKSIGYPVVSDLIYCPKKLVKFDMQWCPRLFLHAKEIVFTHPSSKKPVKFETDLPKDLKDAILNLEKI